jgi:2-C-methyl-D-erythritol 4-phosphate cytidylyltransferase
VPPHEKIWIVVVAGGSGQRFGAPKQFERLGERPTDPRVIDASVQVARSVADGVVVVAPADVASGEGAVPGGATRTESVRAGLAAVPAEATIICVHDAARPFASAELYASVIAAVVAGADGAIPGLPVADTIKVVTSGVAPTVISTPDRASLMAVQTPQAFRADVLRAAHGRGAQGTDDASLVELAGGSVSVVAGEPTNRKITHPEDLEWARRVWARTATAPLGMNPGDTP